MNKINENFHNTLNKLIDKAYFLFVTLGFLLMLSVMFSSLQTGFQSVFPIVTIFYLALTVIFINKDKINFKIKTIFLITGGLIPTIYALCNFGLTSLSIAGFLAFCIIITIFFDKQAGKHSILFCSVAILVIAFLTINGYITYTFDVVKYLHSYVSWISSLLVFILIAIIMVNLTGEVQKFLLESNIQLENEIKQRLNAENEIKKSEEMLSLIYNNASDLIVLLSYEDQNCFRLISCNKSYMEVLNKLDPNTSEKDILGKKYEFILENNFKFDVSMIDNTMKKLNEAVKKGEILRYEMLANLPSIPSYFTETILTPIFDKNGMCTHLMYFSRDISGLKRAEEELKKINVELDIRINQRTNELYLVNLNLLEEIETRKITEKNLLFEKERAEQYVIQLANAQTYLVQSEKMASLGVLTAGIAHEINNPVNYINASIVAMDNIINSFIEVIQKYDNLNQENILEELKQIEDFKKEIDFPDLIKGLGELSKNITLGVSRTTEIIKGLRTFSRLNENEKITFDINENIEMALTLLNNSHNKINITKNLGEIQKITCYYGKINQVIINLLINAIDSIINKKELSDNESIFIATSLKEKNGINYVLTEIKDTGEGIHPDIFKRIFEPFFTTKEVGKGTGLGLAISMNIIKEHNGIIEVESQPGKGSIFKIYLPVN